MNFFGKKSSQNDINYKARLEHKLCLARENPEPVFDLSDCNLKTVPMGVYSLCKVFRKEKLLLQMNQLSSLHGGGQLSDLHLLTHLDLHKNLLTSLSEDIVYLTNLQVLNVSFNSLKKLPKSVGCLNKLKLLDCSHNKLEIVPTSLAELPDLSTLDLRANPGLSSLPSSLQPQNLFVDERVKILDISNNCNSKVPRVVEEHSDSGLLQLSRTPVEIQQIQDPFAILEKKKEDRQKDLLEVEKSMLQQKDAEFKRHESLKQDKDKLILDLKVQQKKMDEDFIIFQSQKEGERSKLLNNLLKVERQSDEKIQNLISLNEMLRQSSHWQVQDSREREILQEYKIRYKELRHKEVIDAMEFLLAEECAQKGKLLEYEKNKIEIIQNSLLRELEEREHMSWMLGIQNAHRSALLTAVETDTEVQKALVATLLERSDLRSRSLLLQVALIQEQLALLTNLELQRRKVESLQNCSDMTEKRKSLSQLLVETLREQQERHRQLTNKLQDLETNRQMTGGSSDYWLQQYQVLLDLQPSQSQTSLDPELVHELVRSGAAHCLPLLACCNIESLSTTQLCQMGLTNVEDQAAVMNVVSRYLKQKQERFSPSAPPLPYSPSKDHQPSAPPAPPAPLPAECVVCMEAQCNIVFVPCGHLCTCASCACHLQLCPLCRSSLGRKILVYTQQV